MVTPQPLPQTRRALVLSTSVWSICTLLWHCGGSDPPHGGALSPQPDPKSARAGCMAVPQTPEHRSLPVTGRQERAVAKDVRGMIFRVHFLTALHIPAASS